jgi:hypothetical protein
MVQNYLRDEDLKLNSSEKKRLKRSKRTST